MSKRKADVGMTLRNLTPEIARRLELPAGRAGAVVADAMQTGPAARAGIRPGDVILEIDREAVEDASEAVATLRWARNGDTMFILVWRQGQELFLTMRISD